jgi:hypothetical protein
VKRLLVLLVALVLLAQPAVATGTSRNLPGSACPAFPANNYWHADISALPLHARSAQWLSHMSPTSKLHPDFGPSYGEQPVPYGIPITYVTKYHARVPVYFEYPAESDRIGYPLGSDTKIEGGPDDVGRPPRDHRRHVGLPGLRNLGDAQERRHLVRRVGRHLVADEQRLAHQRLDVRRCRRPADPARPAALRRDPSRQGRPRDPVHHQQHGPPLHLAGPAPGRLRQQPGVPADGGAVPAQEGSSLTGLRADTQVVLRAMKAYGLVLADNGSPWYFQGTQDTRWPEAMLDQLKRIPASAFEAVDTSRLMISVNSGQSR